MIDDRWEKRGCSLKVKNFEVEGVQSPPGNQPSTKSIHLLPASALLDISYLGVTILAASSSLLKVASCLRRMGIDF